MRYSSISDLPADTYIGCEFEIDVRSDVIFATVGCKTIRARCNEFSESCFLEVRFAIVLIRNLLIESVVDTGLFTVGHKIQPVVSGFPAFIGIVPTHNTFRISFQVREPPVLCIIDILFSAFPWFIAGHILLLVHQGVIGDQFVASSDCGCPILFPERSACQHVIRNTQVQIAVNVLRVSDPGRFEQRYGFFRPKDNGVERRGS